MKIGYLGPKGTFTYFALTLAYGDTIELVEKLSLDRLFDSLISKEVDAIFCPFENSIEGPVNRVLDRLTHSDHFEINDMVTMQINQSILAKQSINYSDVEHIISMPHAIAQCYAFIQKNCPQAKIHHSSSTAGAVTMINSLNLPDDKTIIIGHEGISSFNSIEVLESNVQDQKENVTHFCLIKPTTAETKLRKESSVILSFSTHRDIPGSLLNVLEIFKEYNINLTKILSRPEKSTLGSYIFYVEFEINLDLINLDAMIKSIAQQTLFLKQLGLYKVKRIND